MTTESDTCRKFVGTPLKTMTRTAEKLQHLYPAEENTGAALDYARTLQGGHRVARTSSPPAHASDLRVHVRLSKTN